LLFGPDTLSRAAAPSGSSLLQYSGIAVLRNEHVRLALRFGPHGGCHDHLDKLSVDVETSAGWQSLDVGTSGYGAEITHAWHRSAAPHNTVMISGNRQEGCAGTLTHWSDTSIMAQADAAYPGVMLRRTLSLKSDAWVDTFHIHSEVAQRIDWIFHGDGRFLPDSEAAKAEDLAFTEEDGSGLARLSNAKRLRAKPSRVRGRWSSGEVSQVVELEIPEGFDLYWADAPCNPNGRPMSAVVIRGVASAAVITARFFYPPNR